MSAARSVHEVTEPSVLFVAAQLEPAAGMERAAWHLACALSESRPVTVLVFSGGAPADECSRAEVKLLRLPRKPRRLVIAAIRLRRELRTAPVGTAVVAVGVWAALPTLMASRRSRLIVWEHSLLPGRFPHDRRARLLSLGAYILYRRADAIVAVSESVREFTATLVGRGGPSTVHIPNPVVESTAQCDPRRDRRESRRHSLVFVGRLDRVKNVELALHALSLLPSDIELSVVGDGPSGGALREAARHLGLTDRVRFLGHLDDVRPAIFASSVVVHPSWAETFGYALFEAAQCRRPVVALDRPNMNALIPEAVPGVLVEKATPASFAAGVAQALERDWSEAIFEAAEHVRRRRYNVGLVRQQWVQLLDAV